MPKVNLLKDTNGHPRDGRIRLDELPHKYYIDGCADGYTSCTTFIHTFFGSFDADSIIQNMIKSKNWKSSPYYGSTPDEIKAQLETERVSASSSGTKMHKNIELIYNGLPPNADFYGTDEHMYFMKFKYDHTHLVPFRTEWAIFDDEYKIAGSIDIVFYNTKTNTYDIYDWKRVKRIKKTSLGGNKGLYPLDEYDDCNFLRYSLQLNLYKNLLERLYGLVIGDLCIVVIHPNQTTYKKIHVDAMQTQIGWILDVRARQNTIFSYDDMVHWPELSQHPNLTTTKCTIAQRMPGRQTPRDEHTSTSAAIYSPMTTIEIVPSCASTMQMALGSRTCKGEWMTHRARRRFEQQWQRHLDGRSRPCAWSS